MLKAIEAIYFQWPFCFNCPYRIDQILTGGGGREYGKAGYDKGLKIEVRSDAS